MDRVAIVCAIAIIVASRWHQGVTASRPKMIPEDEELLIHEGDELRLECKGEGELQFSAHKIAEASLQIVQSDFTVSFDEMSGTYTFVRPSATRQDTGWYACAEEGIDIENNDQTIDHPSEDISWIYVYVNSSEPFAVMEALFETLAVLAGQDAVVPCRPTSPTLPVVLERDGSILKDVPYDPKIGFILKEVSKEHAGALYTCKLGGTQANEDITWPMYHLHVEDNKPLGIPVINETGLHHVVWGDDMTSECTFSAARGARFTLNWAVPSSVPRDRIHYITTLNENNKNLLEDSWKTKLTITNVQQSDAGKYTCVVRDVTGQKTQSSINVIIWDLSYTYVNATVTGNADISVHDGESVSWFIDIDTYPENFTWQWYKEGRVLINSTEVDSRSRYSHEQSGSKHIFKISRASVEDSGQYTIHVSTSHNEKIITLSLTVLGQPIVRMYNINFDHYAPRETAIFSAQIEGSPLPNVTWSFIEYPDSQSKASSGLIPLSDIRTERVGGTPFRLLSNLHTTINMTGAVICRSCNTFGCTESMQEISVSGESPPVITYTNMNDSEVRIDLKRDKKTAVILECRADGRPIPEISWYKDNELLKEGN